MRLGSSREHRASTDGKRQRGRSPHGRRIKLNRISRGYSEKFAISSSCSSDDLLVSNPASAGSSFSNTSAVLPYHATAELPWQKRCRWPASTQILRSCETATHRHCVGERQCDSTRIP